jgi:hypothetical protein
MAYKCVITMIKQTINDIPWKKWILRFSLIKHESLVFIFYQINFTSWNKIETSNIIKKSLIHQFMI